MVWALVNLLHKLPIISVNIGSFQRKILHQMVDFCQLKNLIQMLNVAQAHLRPNSASFQDFQGVALDIESLSKLNQLCSRFYSITWISDVVDHCHYQVQTLFKSSIGLNVFKIYSLNWVFVIILVNSWLKYFLFEFIYNIVNELSVNQGLIIFK